MEDRKLKIKDNVDLAVLLRYGFVSTMNVEKEDEDYDLFTTYNYIYWVGHSRRGQHYYLLVGKSREINVYGSTPDGYGGVCALPNVLVKMCLEGLIE